MTLLFPASPELAAEAARLAAAEQACCTFFTFTIQMTTGESRLKVQAPEDAADVVAGMFGAAA